MATVTQQRSDTWDLTGGDEIVPGLIALQLLGGGTRYEAFLAFDERLHHTTVAKVLRPDRISDERARHGLRDEARVLASLNHPAIARLLADGSEAARPHLVLELVEGPRLSSLIRRFGVLETEQAAALAVEVASALHYLHWRGVVHLDVKPKNLIMGAPPRLIDLSIARSVDEAAALAVPVGTDAYMAPEQCAPGPGGVGPGADVWGLGVTLYEALSGRPAFERPSREVDADSIHRFPQLTQRPGPLQADVAPELAEVMWAALSFDPGDRPSAREVAETVEPLFRRPRRFALNRLKPR